MEDAVLEDKAFIMPSAIGTCELTHITRDSFGRHSFWPMPRVRTCGPAGMSTKVPAPSTFGYRRSSELRAELMRAGIPYDSVFVTRKHDK